jgi:hypothetical protein
MANINTKFSQANQLFANWMDSYKKHPVMRRQIREAAMEVCTLLSGVDYLESNFRKLLARRLMKDGFDVYEEVIIPYTCAGYPLPIGHGFADIVLYLPHEDASIILELKTNGKDCSRQLQKYIKHWTYSKILFGVTINFHRDSITINDYEPEKEEGLGPEEVKCRTVAGC